MVQIKLVDYGTSVHLILSGLVTPIEKKKSHRGKFSLAKHLAISMYLYILFCVQLSLFLLFLVVS